MRRLRESFNSTEFICSVILFLGLSLPLCQSLSDILFFVWLTLLSVFLAYHNVHFQFKAENLFDRAYFFKDRPYDVDGPSRIVLKTPFYTENKRGKLKHHPEAGRALSEALLEAYSLSNHSLSLNNHQSIHISSTTEVPFNTREICKYPYSDIDLSGLILEQNHLHLGLYNNIFIRSVTVATSARSLTIDSYDCPSLSHIYLPSKTKVDLTDFFVADIAQDLAIHVPPELLRTYLSDYRWSRATITSKDEPKYHVCFLTIGA